MRYPLCDTISKMYCVIWGGLSLVGPLSLHPILLSKHYPSHINCMLFSCWCTLFLVGRIKKRGGIQKSMGHKVPWNIGMRICHPVTSRPLIFLQKEAVLSSCSFATTHLIAFIWHFFLPVTSRPMKWRTFRNAPEKSSPHKSGYCYTILHLHYSRIYRNHCPCV